MAYIRQRLGRLFRAIHNPHPTISSPAGYTQLISTIGNHDHNDSLASMSGYS